MKKVTPLHGYAYEPASRAVHAMNFWPQDFQEWEAHELEGGKNFPDTSAGSAHYCTSDAPSNTPPADGLILSGGKEDARIRLNYTDAQLIEQGLAPWPRLEVTPSQTIEVHWKYSATHKTRGYVAFITKDGWDNSKQVTREQLETLPFYENISGDEPYWNYPLEPVEVHALPLPANKRGYHVVVLMWIVADTGNAFYQTYDLLFPQ
ncbi:lytic polysaccharide monooxygenase [Enterobacter asburiae]|nr:lytic polysaccharide monooxygenase [Enterobacter asburiae]